MKPSQIVLLILLVFNSACGIIAYSPTEPENKPPEALVHDKIEFLSFSYTPCLARDSDGERKGSSCESQLLEKLPWRFQSLKDLLEHHSRFIKVIVASAPPGQGTHIVIYETEEAPLSGSCKLSFWSLTVIPCYADAVLSKVHFDVYVDNIPKQSYSYDIRRKGTLWIGLLPFTWINLFTNEYADSFRANAYHFIEDARRDGFL